MPVRAITLRVLSHKDVRGAVAPARTSFLSRVARFAFRSLGRLADFAGSRLLAAGASGRARHVGRGDDGEGRNRTGDTTVFSRVLYQLSYLAAAA